MTIVSNNSKDIIYSIKLVVIIYKSIATMIKKRNSVELVWRHVIGLWIDQII